MPTRRRYPILISQITPQARVTDAKSAELGTQFVSLAGHEKKELRVAVVSRRRVAMAQPS